jgi:hypothetical protein
MEQLRTVAGRQVIVVEPRSDRDFKADFATFVQRRADSPTR